MKKYIRMNNNDNNLSLGNFFRIVKEMAKSKSSAQQKDLFCILFEEDDVNDTTVNNYCVGCRSIGEKYKNYFLEKVHNYGKNPAVFAKQLLEFLSIIDGNVYDFNTNAIDFINENKNAQLLSEKLCALAKNDKSVDEKFSSALEYKVKMHATYSALCDEIVYIVLKKKQPIYEESLKKEVINSVLSDTSISSSSLEEYLSLKLKERINYDKKLRDLADKDNAYAAFEIGENEYLGLYKGYPRYNEAYKYLVKAASLNHPNACYLVGRMLVKGLIGNASNEELEEGYEYLKKASDLRNVAATNLIGNMYLEGIHPLKKDETMAITNYKKAARYEYPYAYNNLGKLYEKSNNIDKALENYLISAELGESWACNKVGEIYKKNKKDPETAYDYYLKAIDSNEKDTCYYAYYNLAKYYLNGYKNIAKDESKMLEYFEIASNHGIFDAHVDLFNYYTKKYVSTHKGVYLDKINEYKEKIESSSDVNDKTIKKIEDNILKIKNNKEIDLSLLK